MTKVVNNIKKDTDKMTDSKEVRSLSKYVRSRGEYRSGLTTTTDGGTLVPNQIISVVNDLGKNTFNLKPYLNYIPVKTGKGDYPVMNPNATAETKEELAKYPDVDNDIQTIPFKISTYAGRLQISDELLEDEAFPIMPVLAKQLSTIMTNTTNAVIAQKMQSLPASNISNADSLIQAIESVDPRFLNTIYITQKALAKVMTFKDNNGRYLFNMNGNNNTIMGIKVITIPSYVDNSESVYIGSLSNCMAFLDRMATTLNYNNNNLFGQSLAAVLRFDVEITYPDALKHLTFGDSSK